MKKLAILPFLIFLTSLAFGQSANRYFTYNTQASNYTFVLTDANTKIVQSSSLTGVTFTIDESVTFPVGSQLIAKPDTTGMITAVCSGCDFQDATPVISTVKDAYMIFIKKAAGKWDYTIGGGAGVSSFEDLSDGPGAFSGNALNYFRVNAGETALEYRTPSQVRTDIGAGVGGGDVVGPASATDGVPVLFDGTTGKLIKNSTPTGTGNPVLATSPTLTTPALGTPSAVVLTNGTGLPLTGTTGTLAETRGGTGQTTITLGDLLYGSATNTIGKRAIGTTGQVLTVSGGVPTWQNPNAILDGVTQTTNYTAALTDVGKGIIMSSASTITLTIPTNAVTAFPLYSTFSIMQGNVGQVNFSGPGVTLRVSSGVANTGSIYATATFWKVATDEWIVWNGAPTGYSGVWTPTLTNTANLTASTAYQGQYIVLGNTVTFSVSVDIDPTVTSTLTTLGMTLPVPSAFTTDKQLSGTGAATSVTDAPAGVFSDATNDRITLQYVCVDVTNHVMRITGSYQIL